MKIEIQLILKYNVLDWSNQECDISYKTDVTGKVIINENECDITLYGDEKERILNVFYSIWELLAIYDGYFYTVKEYKINGIKQDYLELYKFKYYKTFSGWISSAQLLARNHRNLSEGVIEKYIQYRNQGRKEKSMISSMFTSYFYVMSESYKEVNIEHKLVLLMHICDGVELSFFNGDDKNNRGNIIRVLNRMDSKKYKQGAKFLDIGKSKSVKALGSTRNELTHYTYFEDSLGSYMENADSETDGRVNLYAFYVMEVALRVSLLEAFGFIVEKEVKEYVMNNILDWIILTRNLDEKCFISKNFMIQLLKRFFLEKKE